VDKYTEMLSLIEDGALPLHYGNMDEMLNDILAEIWEKYMSWFEKCKHVVDRLKEGMINIPS